MSEQSQGEQLIRAIVAFPGYFANFLLGFVVVALTELDMTALVLAALALGLAVQSVFWAVFFFLIAWIIIRTLSNFGLMGYSLRQIAANILYHADQTRNGLTSGGD